MSTKKPETNGTKDMDVDQANDDAKQEANHDDNTSNASNDEPNTSNRETSLKARTTQPKILQQTWKYPYKQVAILLDDNNIYIQQIMDKTKCKITIKTTDHSHHKMIEISLEGTSDQIFNGHQQINYVRQKGRLKLDNTPSLRNRVLKLTNWDLDVTDTSMLNIVHAISSASDATNWAIFQFADHEKQSENIKVLSIEKHGDDGVKNLATNLAHIQELKYCLLRYDYGIEIRRHQVILMIWSPKTAKNGEKKNIIPMLRHKSLIKKTLGATFEITVSIHSYLTPSFILSELHSKNLVSEIILRVTKQCNINDKSSITYAKTDKFLASKQWSLSRLKEELSVRYNISADDIEIAHILHSVEKRSSKFNLPRETERIFAMNDSHKTLDELALYHGSRIYISTVSQQRRLSNRYLAAQRTLQFKQTKTMSTDKFKIELTLSKHLRSRKLKSMKKNVALRIARYEELLKPSNDNTRDEGARRQRSKSTVYGPIKANEDKKGMDDMMLDALTEEAQKEEINDDEIKENDNSDKEMKEIECTLDLNEVFIVEKSVGRGKTAHVHYAVYKNECDIALKEFRFHRLTDKVLYGFHKELETLKKLDHDNICRLLGHYVDEKSNQLYLAFEWVPCGCLYDVIKDENIAIEFRDVLEMSIDIAKGMEYLHAHQIMHRDLKSHNLLLDESYRVKITDFGTAKQLEQISGTTYTEVGTGGYCAPEVIEPPEQGYDKKVDVFSFAVLMWEIFERKNVFDQRCLRRPNQLEKGIRPKISDHCPQKFRNLINQCWQYDPAKRPTFQQIVPKLLSMHSELQ